MAGMVAALAVACAIVALELVGEFGQRASHFRRRADQLQARLGRVEQRLTMANRQVAEMRRETAVREQFNRILAAPDGQLLRLEAPDRRATISGALALSSHFSQAILEVSGLPKEPPAQRYALRWIRRQATPLLAAEFSAEPPDEPDVAIQVAMPPPDASGVVLTLADSGNQSAAQPPLLRGELRKPAKR